MPSHINIMVLLPFLNPGSSEFDLTSESLIGTVADIEDDSGSSKLNQSINQSMNLSMNLSIDLSINLSIMN